MPGFVIKTPTQQVIRFNYYHEAAPVTAAAFSDILPFTKLFFHARVSGQEIWTDKAHGLDIMQENASVFTEPGEIVLGPLKPARTKTADCLGIYYGEGRGLDCCNIFGKVIGEDLPLLKAVGEAIWKNGAVELTFEASE
jgi:hypothetical protein